MDYLSKLVEKNVQKEDEEWTSHISSQTPIIVKPKRKRNKTGCSNPKQEKLILELKKEIEKLKEDNELLQKENSKQLIANPMSLEQNLKLIPIDYFDFSAKEARSAELLVKLAKYHLAVVNFIKDQSPAKKAGTVLSKKALDKYLSELGIKLSGPNDYTDFHRFIMHVGTLLRWGVVDYLSSDYSE